jgi:hypothetical protein
MMLTKLTKYKKAAVISTGWLGDSIFCSAAAASLHEEKGFDVDFYIKWPQLKSILDYDSRFNTILYDKSLFSRTQLSLKLLNYDLVVREPEGWSYEEPNTVEIRKTAGCFPQSEFEIKTPFFIHERKSTTHYLKLAISRDIYKKSYGRNIENLLKILDCKYDINWVGLDPNKSSVFGKKNSRNGRDNSLFKDVEIMLNCDFFFGPEGGLLYLAGGLGLRSVYLSEHIHNLKPLNNHGDCSKTLGNANLFPSSKHIVLPPYSSNEQVIEMISKEFPYY